MDLKCGVVKITSLFDKGLSCSDAILPLLPILEFICVRHLCKCPDDWCYSACSLEYPFHTLYTEVAAAVLLIMHQVHYLLLQNYGVFQLSVENGGDVFISKLSFLDLSIGTAHFFTVSYRGFFTICSSPNPWIMFITLIIIKIRIIIQVTLQQKCI